MAYKDEYEVARLYAETDFAARVAEQFEGPYELRFHLAPPLLAERDPDTGHLKKKTYGPWMLGAFRRSRNAPAARHHLRPVRPHRRASHRAAPDCRVRNRSRRNRARLSPENHEVGVELAGMPLDIRGFGHVKEANVARAKAREAELLARFRAPSPPSSPPRSNNAPRSRRVCPGIGSDSRVRRWRCQGRRGPRIGAGRTLVFGVPRRAPQQRLADGENSDISGNRCRTSATNMSLRVFLRTPHPSMPNLVLQPDDVDDLVDYILSLKPAL